MRAIVFEYHDVVSGGDFDADGFPGEAANSYKISDSTFASHLEAVSSRGVEVNSDVRLLERGSEAPIPILFTFDDGGSGAMPAADMLEARSWRGHFFVTTAQIGERGFLTRDGIRELHRRGHVVGTHSHSHPLRMGRMTAPEVHDEWKHSIEILETILGAPVESASVPGGYYRPFVAAAAAACGIRWLFTSEPVTRVGHVAACAVYGRYTIRRSTGPAFVLSLLGRRSLARTSQWTAWNLKKVAKMIAGDAYLRLRSSLFGDASAPDSLVR